MAIKSLFSNCVAILPSAAIKYLPDSISVALVAVALSDIIYSADVDSLMYSSSLYVSETTAFSVHDLLIVILPSSVSSDSSSGSMPSVV